MTWNNRLVRIQDEECRASWGIKEFHYNQDGEVYTWTEEFVSPICSSIDELKKQLLNMVVTQASSMLEVKPQTEEWELTYEELSYRVRQLDAMNHPPKPEVVEGPCPWEYDEDEDE